MALSSFCTGIVSTSIGNLFLKVFGRVSLSCHLIATRKAAEAAKAVDLNNILAGQDIAIMMAAEKAVFLRCVHLISRLPGNFLASFWNY